MHSSFSRTVNQLYPLPSSENGVSRKQAFSDFLNHKYIVLLGDPGSGKSYLLKEFARHTDSLFLSVGKFAVRKPEKLPKKICIDGLDEKRIDKNSSLIDSIAEKLNTVEPDLCILSCRADDWRGTNDLEILNEYFNEKGGVTVLCLEALTESEQKHILETHHPDIDAVDFIYKANSYNLDGIIKNPQTLLMLANSVASKDWPKTRKELFETCCLQLLKETNDVHTVSNIGQYAAEELLDTAGYIFACLIFSDIQGISLKANKETITHPYFRSLLREGLNEKKIEATIKRRVFGLDGEPHLVTYCHRTIAEYLAARWLSEQIDFGLPINRVQAVMGVDGFPTSELRGVNAWLGVFQNSSYQVFIKKDPYGVLLYGDAACLSTSSKSQLLDGLYQLSIENPTFRDSMFNEPSFSGFFNIELAQKLYTLLRNTNTTFHFRSLILEILRRSETLPILYPLYEEMLFNEDLTFHERHTAIELLAVEPEKCKDFIQRIFPLIDDKSERELLRLKAEILRYWYDLVFTWEDLINFVLEEFNSPADNMVGGYYALQALPTPRDCVKILDNFPNIKELAGDNWYAISDQNNIYNINSLYKHWLIKALDGQSNINGKQLYSWLKKDHHLEMFTHWDFELNENNFATLLRKFETQLYSHFEAILCMEEIQIEEILNFPFTTYNTVSYNGLLKRLINRLKSNSKDIRLDLYTIALKFCEHSPETTEQEFEFLFNFPDSIDDKNLISCRNEFLHVKIPEWRITSAKRNKHEKDKNQENIKRNIQVFKDNFDDIRTGKALNLLNWLANLYLGKIPGTNKDRTQRPLEILDNYFGGTDYQFILAGFIASLYNDEKPSIDKIAKATAKKRSYKVLEVFYVGFFEKWKNSKDLSTWTKEELSYAIIVELHCHYFNTTLGSIRQTRPDWFLRILRQFPELVANTYYKYFALQLSNGSNDIQHLTRLTHTEELKPYRANVLIDLLEKSIFHDVATQITQSLINDGCTREQLHPFLEAALENQNRLKTETRYFWKLLGLLISQNKLQILLDPYLRQESFFEYLSSKFSDIEMIIKNETDDEKNETFDMLITLVSGHYSYRKIDTSLKMSRKRGFAPIELVVRLLNKISATTNEKAISQLNSYSFCSRLKSYSEIIEKAQYNQNILYRERTFQKPNWSGAINTLLNQKPCNYDDYFALIVNFLDETINYLQTDNTNPHNLFWNTAKSGQKKLPTPKDENECRDALLTLLKSRLPSYISAQPEGAQIHEKRTDIVFEYTERGFRLPLEAKRQYHREIWTAAEHQLYSRYMKDEKLSGKGIYVVFWFGDLYIKEMPRRNDSDLAKPNTAIELKEALEANLPQHLKSKMEIRVINLSRA